MKNKLLNFWRHLCYIREKWSFSLILHEKTLKSETLILCFFLFRRFIKKIDVQPPDRIRLMQDMMKEIEKKEHGPCGGYSIMYACMCDYHNTPYREEVAWVGGTALNNLSEICRDWKILTDVSKKFSVSTNLAEITPVGFKQGECWNLTELSVLHMGGYRGIEGRVGLGMGCTMEILNLLNTHHC